MIKPVICADVIAWYGSKLVLLKRLTFPEGLALPGGKQDAGELLSKTATREFDEETGLKLTISGVLGTWADEGRDPRGNYVSTVFLGTASGNPRVEKNKTKILFLTPEEVFARESEFVFDHFRILQNYLNRS